MMTRSQFHRRRSYLGGPNPLELFQPHARIYRDLLDIIAR
jgi:hypothetical protein